MANRDLAVGYRPTYAPLRMIPGRTYTETFNLTDAPPAGGSDDIRFHARLFGPDPKSPVMQCFCEKRSNTLILTITPEETVRLFAQLDRGQEVGEWSIEPGPLATGPVIFKKPPTKELSQQVWFCIQPFAPTVEELTITLKGQDQGEFLEGKAYKQGDIVTVDGRQFYALCDTDGSPGTGPNLNPDDPDSNTLLPEHFPPDDATTDSTATATA